MEIFKVYLCIAYYIYIVLRIFAFDFFVTCLSFCIYFIKKAKFVTVGFYIIYEHMGWWFYTLPWNEKDAVNI